MCDAILQDFGPFGLGRQIGGGRFSQVFRAFLRDTQRATAAIALKRANPITAHSPDYAHLVRHEARILTMMAHAGVCVQRGSGEVADYPYVAMELVDGCTLRSLMRWLSSQTATLPLSATLAVGHQLASVLAYLHEHPTIRLAHLDLNPQNVMVSRDGTIKLIDFGMARLLDEPQPAALTGKIVGTLGYMAPEQACGASNIDERADQYGLGILLWELLSGRRLYGQHAEALWESMRTGVTLSPLEGAHHGTKLQAVLPKLLAPHGEQRFPTMRDAATAMASLRASATAGQLPLGALVQRLLNEPRFDPYDRGSKRAQETAKTTQRPRRGWSCWPSRWFSRTRA